MGTGKNHPAFAATSTGLTKREYIATHLMAGILANGGHLDGAQPSSDPQQLRAEMAVNAADALLEELHRDDDSDKKPFGNMKI